MDAQCCNLCRFWQQNVNPETRVAQYVGACRRHPPTVVHAPGLRADGYPLETVLPDTRSDHWCGDWEALLPQSVDDAATVLARQVIAGDAAAGRALADKLVELIPLPVLAETADDATGESTT